jgi:microcystin-dependent protein
MATPFLGEIRMASFQFAPKGWAFCSGTTMQIAQNQALFALLGTTFGGDGRTTFNLPDLRGRAPMDVGAQGANTIVWGQKGGEETHTLVTAEMPAHSHTPMASSGSPTVPSPTGNFWPNGVPEYSTAQETAMANNAIGLTGGGTGHENRSPYLTINFIIALSGIFPSRN